MNHPTADLTSTSAPSSDARRALTDTADAVASGDADAFQRLLDTRYSCRAFDGRPVPRSIIERMLAMAQRTASWCNAQPWQVLVLSGAATERFRAAMLEQAGTSAPAPDFEWPSAYEGAYQQRRRECGLALYDAVGIERGDRAASARQGLENFRLFGAPHVAIVTSERALGTYGAVDCGAFVGNVMLAATSLGVATVAQASIASRPQVIRDLFGVPADRLVVCGISFGYADEGHPANGFRTSRASLDEAVAWADD